MKAVGYIRVSTQDQAREGWSLGAQRKRIQEHCKAKGWTLARIYADEGVSGKRGTHRPQYERMVRDVLGDGVGVIVALKLDRLGRSALDLLALFKRLEPKGVEFAFLDQAIDTTTPEGRLLRNMLSAFAEFELDIIKARTRNGVHAARAGGKRIGAPPYGFKMSKSAKQAPEGQRGTLVEDPKEQRVIARMIELRRSGMGSHKIAETLNAEGLKPRRGGWHPTNVLRTLRAAGVSVV